MKVILLQHLSGANGAYEVKSEIDVDEATALRYIKKGIAKLKNKKQESELIKKAEDAALKQEQVEAEAKAILEKSQLENELNALYEAVVLKEAAFNGVVLDGSQVLEMVEDLKKRVLLPEGGTYFDLNSLGGAKK